MEAYIGLINLFAGNFAPAKWHFCDGSLVNIKGNEALHYILGDVYGGDGKVKFALPNLNAKITKEGAPKYIICIEGYVPARD